MKKKKTHPNPREYRVLYRINGSLNESTQYYNVFHSSEALDFLAHTYRSGHIHAVGQGDLKILSVEEYDRFSQKWNNRLEQAFEHTTSPEISKDDTGVVRLKHIEDE